MKKPTQPDFSVPAGYNLPNSTGRGISEGASQPVTYKDAARFVEQVEDDINVSGNVDLREATSPEPTLALATFNERGVVYQAEPGAIRGPSRLWGGLNRKVCKGNPNAAGMVMMQSMSAPGVMTTGGLGTIAVDSSTNGHGTKLTTGATSGNTARSSLGFNNNEYVQRRFRPYTFFRLYLSDIVDVRLWMGHFDGNPNTSDTNTARNFVGIRFSTGASDTTFKLMSGDTATNGGPVDLGVTVATGTIYNVEIWDTAAICYARINYGDVKSVSSNLPSLAQSMAGGFAGEINFTTLANAAKAYTVYDIYHEES